MAFLTESMFVMDQTQLQEEVEGGEREYNNVYVWRIPMLL